MGWVRDLSAREISDSIFSALPFLHLKADC